MLHNLYGATYSNALCMQNTKCSKQYPMLFNLETQFGNNGYPNYARPNDSQTFSNLKGHFFNNQSVVSHNLYLLAKYNCHINVKICASVKAVKYIHKYIYKGPN
jgi:hypothetical protein